MHKPESVIKNEMHEILRDLVIQTDHLTQPDNQTWCKFEKINNSFSLFYRSGGPQSENKWKWKDRQILGPC